MPVYKLSKIELNNFRIYRGKKTIEFSTDDNKRITIIQGANGTGKTTLLNAITWCLYGKEYNLPPIANKDNTYSIICNRQEIKEHADGVEVSVKLIFSDEKGAAIKIERSRRYQNLFNEIKPDPKDNFNIMRRDDNGFDFKRISTPEYYIKMLLPENLYWLYFFDGERLDTLFKGEYKEEVDDAIRIQAQLDIIENAVTHLDSVKSCIVKDSKKDPSTSLVSIERKLDEITKEIKALESEEDRYNKNLAEIKKEIKEIDKELSEINHVKIIELVKNREELNNKEKNIQQEIEEEKEKSIAYLVKNAPFIYCKDAIELLNKQIRDMEKTGDLPPKIKAEFVKELLERGECICGTPILQSSPQEQALKQYMDDKKDMLADYITEGKFKIREILEKINSFKDERRKYGENITKKEEEHRDIQRRLKEISDKLSNVNEKHIRDLENERNKYLDFQDKLSREIGKIQGELKYKKQQKEELEKEYKEELRKYEKYRFNLLQIELCEKAIAELNKIKSNMERKIIEQLNQKANKYFTELIWKKGWTLQIKKTNKNYEISVRDNNNNDILGTLSAGEREVLALSFIAALRDAVDIRLPIIVDTPLARISGEVRRNIANLLCHYLEDIQLIMLVTDQEYTNEIRELLYPHVGKELILRFNNEREETEIKERDTIYG